MRSKLVSGPSFDIATIKLAVPNPEDGYGVQFGRGTVVLKNVTLRQAILYAYDLHDYQLSGGPKWTTSDTFQIVGKTDPSVSKIEAVRPMLQTLLKERFQLTLRKETKPLPAYALITAKGGPKLERAAPDAVHGWSSGSAKLTARAASVQDFADLLASKLGRPVMDRTGIDGKFNFNLHFAPDNAPPDTMEPSLFTALQEQLGLKLETTTAPGDTFVIERAEHPSDN